MPIYLHLQINTQHYCFDNIQIIIFLSNSKCLNCLSYVFIIIQISETEHSQCEKTWYFCQFSYKIGGLESDWNPLLLLRYITHLSSYFFEKVFRYGIWRQETHTFAHTSSAADVRNCSSFIKGIARGIVSVCISRIHALSHYFKIQTKRISINRVFEIYCAIWKKLLDDPINRCTCWQL